MPRRYPEGAPTVDNLCKQTPCKTGQTQSGCPMKDYCHVAMRGGGIHAYERTYAWLKGLDPRRRADFCDGQSGVIPEMWDYRKQASHARIIR